MDRFLAILRNHDIMIWVMAIIVFLLTQVLKLPIKHFTKKIKVEKTRKAINSVILVLPFVLGCLFEFLYCRFIKKEAFDVVAGFLMGGQSIAFYGIFERFLGVKIENPYDTDEGKAVLDSVSDAVSDGTVTTDEIKDVAKTAITGERKSAKDKKKKKEADETPEELQKFLDGIDLK